VDAVLPDEDEGATSVLVLSGNLLSSIRLRDGESIFQSSACYDEEDDENVCTMRLVSAAKDQPLVVYGTVQNIASGEVSVVANTFSLRGSVTASATIAIGGGKGVKGCKVVAKATLFCVAADGTAHVLRDGAFVPSPALDGITLAGIPPQAETAAPVVIAAVVGGGLVAVTVSADGAGGAELVDTGKGNGPVESLTVVPFEQAFYLVTIARNDDTLDYSHVPPSFFLVFFRLRFSHVGALSIYASFCLPPHPASSPPSPYPVRVSRFAPNPCLHMGVEQCSWCVCWCLCRCVRWCVWVGTPGCGVRRVACASV
jgi:hypothetical protein